VTYICFINDNICPFILKRHIRTFHISFICRWSFNAHVNVMYHKQICRLQPTTSYHTVLGFPILASVPVQNFSKFEFINVTFCVCSFRMNLLVQNDHLRDPLKDWNSQGYRFTVSLYFISGWRWASVPTQDTCKARHFRWSSSFQFYYNHVQFFFLSLSSVMVSYRGSPGYICLWKISTWLFAKVFHEVWRHGENL